MMAHAWGVLVGPIRWLGKGVIVCVLAVFLVGWVVVLPPAAGADTGFVAHNPATNTYTISPSGSDDTASIQAAFDGCTATASTCTVRLASGTFYTAQIVVHNFQGDFQGMGQGVTTVLALPNLPVTKDAPFNLHLPSADNPWPNLFTFFDGTYSISGMTFVEPYAKPMQGYRTFDTPGIIFALNAFVSITGLNAGVTVDHVTMIGAPGDFALYSPFRFNAVDGIFPQALLLQPGSGLPFAKPHKSVVGGLLPLQVTFSVRDSAFYTIDDPLGFEELVDSAVTVSGNTFDTVEWAVAAGYMSNSVSTISGNQARNVMGEFGVEAYSGASFSTVLGCPELSQIVVTENDFQVTRGGGGVSFFDFGFLTGCAPSLEGVAKDNTIRMDATSGLGLYNHFAQASSFSGNTILGPGSWGVIVQGGSSIVEGNRIEDVGQWGIGLVNGASDCLIKQNTVTGSGLYDLYWDGTGSGNVWTRNVFQTEFPPGLSS